MITIKEVGTERGLERRRRRRSMVKREQDK
jgi:hypothetical protein